MNGYLPINFPDIAAWAALTGAAVTSFEVRLLCRIDDAFLAWARPAEDKATVSVNDDAGMRDMMQSLKAKNAGKPPLKIRSGAKVSGATAHG